MFSFLNAADQATTSAPATGVNNIMASLGQLLPFILIAVIFYFFIIRPQQKQRRALTQMINNLKNGDKVITKGGIIGTVFQVLENTLILQLHDGIKIETLKHAIISLMNGEK